MAQTDLVRIVKVHYTGKKTIWKENLTEVEARKMVSEYFDGNPWEQDFLLEVEDQSEPFDADQYTRRAKQYPHMVLGLLGENHI